MAKSKKTATSKKKVTTTAIHIESGNDKTKETITEILKIEKYKTKGRVFNIETTRDNKKSRLIIYVFEIRDGQRYYIHELKSTLSLEKNVQNAANNEKYDNAIAGIKDSLIKYAAGANP